MPIEERPLFMAAYFPDIDHAGHSFGPDSPQVDEALVRIDTGLSALVQGLNDRDMLNDVNIVVVSDRTLR
jgi:predicted AlkP superfamily pyrophosphatase or phosphodiesterase